MSKPYDASTKYLMEHHLADWLPLSSRPAAGPVEIVDTDVSTVTAAADKVLLVGGPAPWVLHVELQSSWEDVLPGRMHYYNALLEHHHGAPVHSMVLVLRKAADSPGYTGRYENGFPGEPPYRTFQYQVVRVWQLPLETFLGGGLGLLPLAPLTDEAAGRLPEVVRRMDERLRGEASREDAGNLWTAADVLMGLRYERSVVEQILRGVGQMEESVTYQAIIEKGIAIGRQGLLEVSRDVFLAGATERFGEPDAAILARLQAITDPKQFEELSRRSVHVSTWDELLPPE